MVKILTIILAVSWSMAIVAQEKVTGHVYDPSHKAIVGACCNAQQSRFHLHLWRGER